MEVYFGREMMERSDRRDLPCDLVGDMSDDDGSVELRGFAPSSVRSAGDDTGADGTTRSLVESVEDMPGAGAEL